MNVEKHQSTDPHVGLAHKAQYIKWTSPSVKCTIYKDSKGDQEFPRIVNLQSF